MIPFTSRPARPRLVFVGWAGLLVAVLLPFCASITMIVMNRLYQSCIEGTQVSFAPLVISCGPPNLGELVVGWVGTMLTLGGLLVSVIASVALLFMLKTSRRTWRIAPAVHLTATTLIVLSVVAYYLIIDPIGRAERIGAWTTAVSSVATVALLLSISVGAAIRGAARAWSRA